PGRVRQRDHYRVVSALVCEDGVRRDDELELRWRARPGDRDDREVGLKAWGGDGEVRAPGRRARGERRQRVDLPGRYRGGEVGGHDGRVGRRYGHRAGG